MTSEDSREAQTWSAAGVGGHRQHDGLGLARELALVVGGVSAVVGGDGVTVVGACGGLVDSGDVAVVDTGGIGIAAADVSDVGVVAVDVGDLGVAAAGVGVAPMPPETPPGPPQQCDTILPMEVRVTLARLALKRNPLWWIRGMMSRARPNPA